MNHVWKGQLRLHRLTTSKQDFMGGDVLREGGQQGWARWAAWEHNQLLCFGK